MRTECETGASQKLRKTFRRRVGAKPLCYLAKVVAATATGGYCGKVRGPASALATVIQLELSYLSCKRARKAWRRPAG